jgi:hypothetical protein
MDSRCTSERNVAFFDDPHPERLSPPDGLWQAIGLPALISLQEKMVNNSALSKQFKVCVDYGEVMPNVP